MKETDYQQRIRQLEVALKKSRESEMGLQTRLQEAVSELKCTKAQVADLRIVVEKGLQEVRKSKEREVDLKVRLEEAASTLIDVYMQVTYLQAVMEQGQQDLRKSEEREASLQRRLQEAVSELECTKAQVADLHIVMEKGHQEVRVTKLQYEVNKKVLISANHTIHEDLKAVCNQLNIAVHS